MDVLVKFKANSPETDINGLLSYLKTNRSVQKFDVRSDDMQLIEKISDKETINALLLTSSKALTSFLENENESIF